MKAASLVLSVAEIAQLAQAMATLATLLDKIKTHAPDVWAEVQSDYVGALANWQQAAPADVASIVAGSGQLPGMPSPLIENATHTPEQIAALEKQFAESVVAVGLAQPAPGVDAATPGAETAQAGTVYPGADALPLGTHVQAAGVASSETAPQ